VKQLLKERNSIPDTTGTKISDLFNPEEFRQQMQEMQEAIKKEMEKLNSEEFRQQKI